MCVHTLRYQGVYVHVHVYLLMIGAKGSYARQYLVGMPSLSDRLIGH